MNRPPHSLATPMPNVIVHPPEEELESNGPWCFFDAGQSSLGQDLELVANALGNDTPHSHRDGCEREEIIMPRRSEPQWTDDLDIFDDGIERAPGNDSEVIEVIKLSKHAPVETEERSQKSSLKSRASRAFKSIKKVASRSSSRTRKDSAASVDDAHTTSSIPLSRRSSVSLFNLFQAAPKNHSTSDISTPPRSHSPTPSSFNTLRRSDTATYDEFMDEQAEDTQATPRPLRPTSPSSHFATRRFSRANLHRIFSFGSEKDSVYSTTTTPRMSRDASSSNSSALSSEEPQTPIDSLPPLIPSTSKHTTTTSSSSPEVLDADVSYELRLDSLHFESLSFDPDNF